MGKVKGRSKQTLMRGVMIPSFVLMISISGAFYLMVDARARDKLRNELEKKVEIIADTNNSNGLDIKEMLKLYENLGLNFIDEVKSRGFNLSIDEMQQYLKNRGRFNPETDAYNFRDGFR